MLSNNNNATGRNARRANFGHGARSRNTNKVGSGRPVYATGMPGVEVISPGDPTSMGRIKQQLITVIGEWYGTMATFLESGAYAPPVVNTTPLSPNLSDAMRHQIEICRAMDFVAEEREYTGKLISIFHLLKNILTNEMVLIINENAAFKTLKIKCDDPLGLWNLMVLLFDKPSKFRSTKPMCPTLRVRPFR